MEGEARNVDKPSDKFRGKVKGGGRACEGGMVERSLGLLRVCVCVFVSLKYWKLA